VAGGTNGAATSISEEILGDSGNGVEHGERGRWLDKFGGEGDTLADAPVEEGFEASPTANVAARSLSSRVNFGNLWSLTPAFFGDPGLPGRCEARDLRRLSRADSANWPEDSGGDGRNCESMELECESGLLGSAEG
jgi:hypothetical protein